MARNKKMKYDDKKCCICEKVYVNFIMIDSAQENSDESMTPICLDCASRVFEYMGRLKEVLSKA